ncbi:MULTISPECIES: response regulator [unclassified Frankia]|uniref:response regulator n=1 Tax=unclassified Frankia TaxID=2632575 RepID=UPI002024E410
MTTPRAERPIRVVIADDHPMYRFGLGAALEATDEVEVVGDAADGQELLEAVARHTPDVVLTDLTMPKMDGTEAARQIGERFPSVAVLILTMHADDNALQAALDAGALGYLLKSADRDDIVQAVRSVARGHAFFGDGMARRLIGLREATRPNLPFPQLSAREREVLTLAAAGDGNRQIAGKLFLAEKTVRNHISQILVKLAVPDRTAAIIKARDAGLGR